MIREEYLTAATRDNLYGLRLVRDTAALLQTGVRAGAIEDLLEAERIKLVAETQLSKAIRFAEGFTGVTGDTGYLTQFTASCEVRTVLLGVGLDLKLTPAERQVLRSAAQPPVGMRGTLYDEQRTLSAAAAESAQSALAYIVRVSAAQTEGKLLTGFSLTALDSLRGICADFGVTAAANAQGEGARLMSRPDVVKRLCQLGAAAIDESETKLKDWIASCENGPVAVLARLTGAAAGGALKSTLPPLFYDLAYRYALQAE